MSERAKATVKAPAAKAEKAAARVRQLESVSSYASHHEQVIHLQRTIGNQAVQKLFRSGILQARLKINQPGDVYEQEADRVAGQVMRMTEPGIQMKPTRPLAKASRCGEQEIRRKPTETKPFVQRNIENAEGCSDLESGKSTEIIRGGGQPLPESTRTFFEPRFKHDFTRVRLHADSSAAESARAINARAYTIGSDMVFSAGQFAPATAAGKRLLAHELAHVVQQSRAGTTIQRAPVPGASQDPQKASRGGSSPTMPGGDYYGQALSEAKRSGYGEAARLPDARNMFLYFKLWDRLDEVKKHMWEIRIAFLTWGRDFHNAEDEYRKNLYGILADLRDFAKEYDRETGRFHLFEHERTAAVRQKVQESIERLDKFLLERDLLVTGLFKEEREVQSQDEKISEQIEQLDRILDDIYNRRFTGGPAISKGEYNSIISRLIAISQQADPVDRKMRDLMERYLNLNPGHGNP